METASAKDKTKPARKCLKMIQPSDLSDSLFSADNLKDKLEDDNESAIAEELTVPEEDTITQINIQMPDIAHKDQTTIIKVNKN